jgi:flavodoxin
MKTIIVYYSNTHNNELLAYHLQKKLSCKVLKIEEVRKRIGLTIFLDILFSRNPKLKDHGISLGQYEHFILIAPIWAGKIASPMRSFMKKERKCITSYSFITLCGGVTGQIEKIRAELNVILEQHPTMVEELWISSLQLGAAKIPNYHIKEDDLKCFSKQIEKFVETQPASSEVEISPC